MHEYKGIKFHINSTKPMMYYLVGISKEWKELKAKDFKNAVTEIKKIIDEMQNININDLKSYIN